MRYRCYAKINLTLEILGKRPDGFHELASVVHTISLADDLHVELADTLRTHVEGQDIPPEINLVARAATLASTSLDEHRGAELRLIKRIPSAAGLGGGSSDAAATLVALNRLWGRRLSTTALCQLAARLGSDVPFFLRGGAALMRGRGDDLESLPPLANQWLVLLAPHHLLDDKTRRLYAALDPRDFTTGDMTLRAAERLRHSAALNERELVNGFERAARKVFPGLDELWRTAERISHQRFHLSGAGPALFTLAANHAETQHLAARLDHLPAQVFAVRTVRHARASLRRSAIEYA
ncbi:MAG TPA: 4-(cytidine 5'-diphospho)-2-C-methyl-D-erythritol kinase [Chloroflexota bacterium]